MYLKTQVTYRTHTFKPKSQICVCYMYFTKKHQSQRSDPILWAYQKVMFPPAPLSAAGPVWSNVILILHNQENQHQQSTINIMFHLLVDAMLWAIAILSDEEKDFVHSRYKKRFYNWDIINAQGNVGGVFVMGILWLIPWVDACYLILQNLNDFVQDKFWGGKWIQKWDLSFVTWVFR